MQVFRYLGDASVAVVGRYSLSHRTIEICNVDLMCDSSNGFAALDTDHERFGGFSSCCLAVRPLRWIRNQFKIENAMWFSSTGRVS